MSRLEELIEELCPEGVVYRPLGEVGTFTRGSGLQKKDFAESGYPCIHYGQIYTHYGVWATETKSFIDPDLASRLHRAQPGDLIIATTSENDEDVCKAVAWLGEGEVAVSNDACFYHHDLDPKFASYWFQSNGFQDQKNRAITGTKVRRVSAESMSKMQIPVPPLLVQQEIVRILDTYVTLKAELKAELKAREHQYVWYRDRLIENANDEVPWVPLSNLGEFFRGRRFTKKDYVDEGVPAIHYGEIYTSYGVSADKTLSHVRSDSGLKLRFAQPGDVVLTDVGETVEDVGKAVAWVGANDVAIHDHCYAFRSMIDPVYASYCMQTSRFVREKARFVARTKVKTLLIEGFSSIRIPVPSRDEQGRIVKVLNSFDALVNDLSSGLPAEIAARHQQYEYYRDRLLSFAELPA